MVVSERARATGLANACPTLQLGIYLNRGPWYRPFPSLQPLLRYRSSPCLLFNNLFLKMIDHNVFPPPPSMKIVPLMEQRLMKGCWEDGNGADVASRFTPIAICVSFFVVSKPPLIGPSYEERVLLSKIQSWR
ncbi:uncharacterized protein ARMOST_21546 [Armillaria ostoyae]|uniref:Uncharacterized protein n=1 Tax=Armillaria ostoyae TaxID=47428 RepID=A0A284SAH4_ARMOS|nr:uncharacterized protein ARMOST_21546 [Armillaria ostoyae]